MIKTIVAVVCLGLALSVAAPAFADKGGVKNEHAVANCQANIAKQDANGQTGANTGSANDSKQADTAVTNCDGFWNQ